MKTDHLLKDNNRFTRRRWLALSLLGSAGFWAGTNNVLGARIFRKMISENTRGMAMPRHRPEPGAWDGNRITAAWLGHSSVLVNLLGVNILTDPVLFRRVGADLRLGTVGPRRLVAPALTVEQLPRIDVVLLSHAHMDHLDLPTLKCLPARAHAVCARANADLLKRTRMRHVSELGWGEKRKLSTPAGKLEVQAFEVKHWGARWRHDTHRGYNGYVLSRGGRQIIFGGDTAHTADTFRALRRRGPYDLAIMPIGAYHPWLCSHCNPEQAVDMANQAGARYFLPIHHRTFPLGREPRSEPAERVAAALEKERLALSEVGQTFSC